MINGKFFGVTGFIIWNHKAEIIQIRKNKCYRSYLLEPKGIFDEDPYKNDISHPMDALLISETEVKKKLDKLNVTKSSDSDEVHLRILYELKG